MDKIERTDLEKSLTPVCIAAQVLSNVVFVLLLTVIDWAGENFFFYAWLLVLVVSVVLYAVYVRKIITSSYTPC